ncbi:DNA-binding protein, partial [Halobacteriales archaeon QS_9_67_17]
DEAADVALIDRLMPDLSGDEVLDRIRDEEYECRVAMVTAVEPDFDIIEMGFDDYLVKPVRREELNEAVQDLSDRAAYSERLREYYALSSKRATLDTQKSQRELGESDAYAELVAEIEQMSDELDEVVADFSPEEFEAELRKLDDG